MTFRKFYKTIITYEVLSEEPIPNGYSTQDIIDMCYEGDYSGVTVGNKEILLNGKEAAQSLIEQGSGPEFFRLNEEGEDI